MSEQESYYGIPASPDREYFLRLAKAIMPYGKYAGRRLIDLPEHYIVWFSQRGFPKGELGQMLREVYEIKLNGLEYLFKPFQRS
ncbi:DUF3820 family protein [bacterium]